MEITKPIFIELAGFKVQPSGQRKKLAKFICYCGKQFIAQMSYVNTGHTKSCGCLAIESIRNRSFKHGLSCNKLYSVWKGMHNRCYNQDFNDYSNYGGRGITVCDRWHDVKLFVSDMQVGYKHGLQLDRINNDGNYEPSNCKWSTRSENNRNKRDTRYVIYNGEKIALVILCERLKLKYCAINTRLHMGWDINRALTVPVKILKPSI